MLKVHIPCQLCRNINPLLPQIHFRLINLLHQFLIRVGNIVECEDSEAEFEEEVCAKGDEGPEGKLQSCRTIPSGRDTHWFSKC